MARTLIPLLLILHSGCDDRSSRSRPPEPDLKRQLPAEVMRAMIAPGEPCIRKFRSTMPEAYVARAWVNRSPEGFLTIEFRAGDQVEFNACIADAIRAARIPVELAGPVEVPLAFDFKNPGA